MKAVNNNFAQVKLARDHFFYEMNFLKAQRLRKQTYRILESSSGVTSNERHPIGRLRSTNIHSFSNQTLSWSDAALKVLSVFFD